MSGAAPGRTRMRHSGDACRSEHSAAHLQKGGGCRAHGGKPDLATLSHDPEGQNAEACLKGALPQRWPKKRLDRRLEEGAKAVRGGYCRLQMPLKLALAVMETVAGHRLGALEVGGGGGFQRIPARHWGAGWVGGSRGDGWLGPAPPAPPSGIQF